MIDKPFYISKENFEKLKTELNFLLTNKRPEVAERIERAKEFGDLSENAEYADAKDEMAFVEGKILEIKDKINRAEIIKEPAKNGTVSIGSKVTLMCNGAERFYHIVGPDEANPGEGKISNETPLAEGLLGKRIEEEVEITIPAGKLKCVIKKIE